MAVLGFRRFIVDRFGRLRPLAGGSVGGDSSRTWYPERACATAFCARIAMGGYIASEVVQPHAVAPEEACSCGLYAYASPIAHCLCSHPSSPLHGAVGVVRLWGRVIHCRYEDGNLGGYRAQYGRVVALRDFTGRVLPEYNVPRYRSLKQMHSEWRIDTPQRHTPGEYDCGRWCESYGGIQTVENAASAVSRGFHRNRKGIGGPQGLMQPITATFNSGQAAQTIHQMGTNFNPATQQIAAFIRQYGYQRYGNPPGGSYTED